MLVCALDLATFRGRALPLWRAGDGSALRALCSQATEGPLDRETLLRQPELAWWLALSALMTGDAEALEYLDAAYRGEQAAGRAERSAVVASAALVVCLLDNGAMEHIGVWLDRAAPDTLLPAPTDVFDRFWLCTGRLARIALGTVDDEAGSDAPAAAWLEEQLRPFGSLLSSDERLVAALVLANHSFTLQRFEQFDHLANLVEAPAVFAAASPLMRARWLYTAGFAHYQLGAFDAAHATWQRALAAGRDGPPASHLPLLISLALIRLQIDRGETREAGRLLGQVRPEWGAGRTAQLVHLQQLRARLLLLQGQSQPAFDALNDALRLAEKAGIPAAECASCHTDLAQIHIALGQEDRALALLDDLAARHGGRDRQVYDCLALLLRAWLERLDPAAGTTSLARGLGSAQAARYAMFFRLLPALAADICALALRHRIEVPFVEQAIQSRGLQAPADADEQWPWALWVRMLGGIELRQDGKIRPKVPGKTQQKPTELLHLLACQNEMALDLVALGESLWPDIDDDAASRKNVEMAVLRLRRLLGDESLVWVSGGRVGLDPGRVASDVVVRRHLIDRIQALALRGGRRADDVVTETLGLVERILALSRGDLLPGRSAPAPWLIHEREQSRLETVRGVLCAAGILDLHGAGTAEIELLQAALRIEPLAEQLACRLMRALEAAGRRGDALRIFENLRRALERHGAQPGATALSGGAGCSLRPRAEPLGCRGQCGPGESAWRVIGVRSAFEPSSRVTRNLPVDKRAAAIARSSEAFRFLSRAATCALASAGRRPGSGLTTTDSGPLPLAFHRSTRASTARGSGLTLPSAKSLWKISGTPAAL